MPHQEGTVRGTAVSKLPLGLLGLLGLKSQGDHPLYLRNDYATVIDQLWDLLHGNYHEKIRITGVGVTAVGNDTSLPLSPAFGEAWYVPAGGYTAILPPVAAAKTVNASLLMGRGTTAAAGVMPLTPDPIDHALAIGEAMSLVNSFPFFLPPGSSLGLRINKPVGGTGAVDTWTLTVHFLRLTL